MAIDTPFGDGGGGGLSDGDDGGGDSDADTNNADTSSVPRGRRRARDRRSGLSDDGGDGGGSEDVPNPDPDDPSTAPSATPAPSAGDDAGASNPSDGTDVETPDPNDPSTAPSATGAPEAGDDAGATTPSGTTDTPPSETTDPSTTADDTADAVEGYPTSVPDIAAPPDSGTAAATDAVSEFFDRADMDEEVADAATSGGFSRLPLPTIDFSEPAAQYRRLVEEREQGFTTTTATLPGIGDVPVGIRLDMSEEDSPDTASDQFLEGAAQSLNPAAAIEDTENLAEAADNPFVYARNPGETGETAVAAADQFGEDLARAADENPYGLAGALTPALVGGGATAVSAARAGKSAAGLSAAVRAELDPRVGPFGTTLETKAVRGIRDRVSDLPSPRGERGQMQLGKFETRGSDTSSSDSSTVTLDESTLADESSIADPGGEGQLAKPPQGVSGVSRDPIKQGLDEQGAFVGSYTRGQDPAFGGTGKPNVGTDRDFSDAFSGPEPIDRGTDVATDADADVPAAEGIMSSPLFGSAALSEAGQTRVDAGSALDPGQDSDPTTFADVSVDATTGQGSTLPFADEIGSLTGTLTTELDAGADDVTDPITGTDTGPSVSDNTGPDVFTDPTTDVFADPETDQPVGQDTPQDTGVDTPQDTGVDTPQDTGVDTPQDVPQEPPLDPPAQDPPARDPSRDDPFDFGSDPPRDPPECVPEIPEPQRRRQQDDDNRREDYSDIFENPTLSPEEALDFTPLED